MFRLGRLIAFLGLCLALGNGVSAGGPDEEAVVKFGIIGTWAVDCSKPLSPSNPYQTYARGEVYPTRTLSMATKELDGVFEMRRARLIGSNQLAYTDRKQHRERPTFDVILEKTGGRLRSVSSIANDGKVIIREGRFVDTGVPTLAFQRCSTN